MAKKVVEDTLPSSSAKKVAEDKLPSSSANFDANGMIRMPERFAAINRVVMRDLNANPRSPSFYLYSKDQITEYIKNPYSNQKALRNAAIYLYNASGHFRRLIQYFVSLSDLAYVVAPTRIDTSKAKPETIARQYRKTLNTLTIMDIKNQFPKILTVCLREDTFFGTMWVTNDNIIIQQLPSDYCDVSVIENGVLNVTFDFSYFDANSEYLAMYPKEFTTKYNAYLKDRTKMKWQELDSPNSFAVKCNTDILNYSIPPFAGMFREVYDLEDYKALKLTKTELENYALLIMQLGINDDGDWEMPLNQAKDFYRNLDNVLPEEVGAVLSPMPINKISFERSTAADNDTIMDAEQNLYTSAGVSSLLFNNAKASSNALLLSIKADQAITYGVVKSLEGVVNRFIQSLSFGKNFRVTFLDCSPFNRKEMGDQYLKAAQYGLPTLSYYAASQGISQADLDGLNFLEDDVLNFKERFDPLRTSTTSSGKSNLDDQGGRPTKDVGDLSDSGEQSQESGDGDNDGI